MENHNVNEVIGGAIGGQPIYNQMLDDHNSRKRGHEFYHEPGDLYHYLRISYPHWQWTLMERDLLDVLDFMRPFTTILTRTAINAIHATFGRPDETEENQEQAIDFCLDVYDTQLARFSVIEDANLGLNELMPIISRVRRECRNINNFIKSKGNGQFNLQDMEFLQLEYNWLCVHKKLLDQIIPEMHDMISFMGRVGIYHNIGPGTFHDFDIDTITTRLNEGLAMLCKAHDCSISCHSRIIIIRTIFNKYDYILDDIYLDEVNIRVKPWFPQVGAENNGNNDGGPGPDPDGLPPDLDDDSDSNESNGSGTGEEASSDSNSDEENYDNRFASMRPISPIPENTGEDTGAESSTHSRPAPRGSGEWDTTSSSSSDGGISFTARPSSPIRDQGSQVVEAIPPGQRFVTPPRAAASLPRDYGEPGRHQGTRKTRYPMSGSQEQLYDNNFDIKEPDDLGDEFQVDPNELLLELNDLSRIHHETEESDDTDEEFFGGLQNISQQYSETTQPESVASPQPYRPEVIPSGENYVIPPEATTPPRHDYGAPSTSQLDDLDDELGEIGSRSPAKRLRVDLEDDTSDRPADNQFDSMRPLPAIPEDTGEDTYRPQQFSLREHFDQNSWLSDVSQGAPHRYVGAPPQPHPDEMPARRRRLCRRCRLFFCCCPGGCNIM